MKGFLKSFLLIILPVLFFSACVHDRLKENPLKGGWSYAVGREEDTVEEAAAYQYQVLTELVGLERYLENRNGFIWIRNDFEIPEGLDAQEISVLLGRIVIAGEVYFNQERLGRSGHFPPHFFSNWNSYRYYPLPESLIRDSNSLMIKIYVNGEGSLTGEIMLGEREEVNRLYQKEEFINSNINILIFAILIILSVYHFLLFIQRRDDRENLHYSILTLSYAVYLTNFFLFKIPGFPGSLSYLLFQKIIFIALFAAAFSLSNFFRDFLGYSISGRIEWISRAVFIIQVVITAFIPEYRILNRVIPILQISLLVPFGRCLIYESKALKENNRDAHVLLWGLIPFFFSALFDLVVHQLFQFYTGIFLLNLGVPLFIISILFVLASRFVRYHNDVEELNKTLEKKVEDRTAALQKANIEIETAMNELQKKAEIAKKDLEMAAAVQNSLYSQKAPDTNGWSAAYFFKPMAGVSGDLYDFYLDGKNLDGAVLLDVSGHGLASGLVSLVAKSIVRRQFTQNRDKSLGKIVTKANDTLVRELKNVDNYITGVFLKFNDEIVEYVNAGHTEILLKKKETGKVHIVNKKEDFKGWFLGLPDLVKNYTTLKFKAASGDTLLLYTDCLLETCNAAGEEYGLERIKASFAKADQESCQGMVRSILDDFREFTGKSDFEDDMTLIVLKKKFSGFWQGNE